MPIGGDQVLRSGLAFLPRSLTPIVHEGNTRTLAVSPDGKWLATASGGRGWRWLLQPQDLIAEACARLTRKLTPQEWQQYISEEPYRKTCPELP